jgi:hypothetical protein
MAEAILAKPSLEPSDLSIGIELHAETAAIIARLCLAQAGNTARCRIAMGAAVFHRFLQLGNDMLGRGHVGIAHAKVDNIHPLSAQLGLDGIDMGKHVRGKTADAVKICAHIVLGGPKGA